jgi:hypothetical protein
MSHGLKELMLLGAMALVIVAVGCSEEEGSNATATSGAGSSGSADTSHDEGGHEHPSEGPHHGSLIEFGDHEYHGEFVHDDESITIYILDGEAAEQVPIEAESITLNVTPEEGDPVQHELTADPDEGDPEGQSSRFVLTDAAVVEMLDAEGTTARVSVTILDTPYSGDISHDHGDHGHSHD